MNYELLIKNKEGQKTKKRSTFYAPRFTTEGFSLVETIMAVSIIALAMVSPMTAAQRALVSAEYSRDQMKAYYLAEEGLEYIHYTRDVNAVKGNSWLSSLNNCIVKGNSKSGCSVDPHVSSPQDTTSCSDPDNTPTVCKLDFNKSTGIYSHQTGGDFLATPFRRWAKIYDNVSNPSEKKVVVSVEWQTGSLPKRIITVTGVITDWKEQVSN